MNKEADSILLLACDLLDLNASVSVTLMVKGLIVTGFIISYEDYMNGICSDFESGQGLSPVLGKFLRESFESVLSKS
jgi:hypothetical protein